MKAFHKTLLAGLVAMSLGGSALAAEATMCGDMMGQMQGRGQQMRQMDKSQMAERMKMRMEQRHTALHHKLKLTPEQEPAWKSFIAGAKPPMLGMMGLQRADMMKLSAPERMEKMIERMKERQAHMTARLVELKKFYAVLTPEQQKIFDAEMMAGPRAGQGRGMKRGMRRGSQHAPAPAAN